MFPFVLLYIVYIHVFIFFRNYLTESNKDPLTQISVSKYTLVQNNYNVRNIIITKVWEAVWVNCHNLKRIGQLQIPCAVKVIKKGSKCNNV